MKKISLYKLILLGSLFVANWGFGQDQADTRDKINEGIKSKTTTMKTYLIEREIPGAGDLKAEQLKEISRKSNEVLSGMGPGIEWLHSYVTDNKVYCIYKAENEVLLRKHAEQGGFPIDKVSTLAIEISPKTAGDQN